MTGRRTAAVLLTLFCLAAAGSYALLIWLGQQMIERTHRDHRR